MIWFIAWIALGAAAVPLIEKSEGPPPEPQGFFKTLVIILGPICLFMLLIAKIVRKKYNIK